MRGSEDEGEEEAGGEGEGEAKAEAGGIIEAGEKEKEAARVLVRSLRGRPHT